MKLTKISILGITSVSIAAIALTHDALGAALHVNQGETLVEHNSVVVGNNRFEIDGVCKLSEDGALCWKPDASPNPGLTEKINAAILSPIYANQRTFTVSLLKKQRTLIMKATQVSQSQNGVDGGTVYRRNPNDNTFSEGWLEYSNTNFSANESGFNGGQTYWHSIDGKFELGTKEFSLQYEFTIRGTKPIIKDLEVGKIEVDGNVFEIVSITDHPKPKPRPNEDLIRFAGGYNPFPSAPQPEPKTDIAIKVVAINNPYSSMTIQLADEKGQLIYYVDDKFNPVSFDVVNKWNAKNNIYVPGKQPPKSPFIYAGGYSFDQKYNSKVGVTTPSAFYVPKEKCKRIMITSTKHDVYVFEHVKLDPN